MLNAFRSLITPNSPVNRGFIMFRLIAFAELTMGMALAGSSVVAGKIITTRMPVFIASELRFLIASLIFVPILVRGHSGHGIHRITPWQFGFLFLQSLCGNFAFSVCLLYGLRLTGAAEAGIITGTAPMVLALLSVLILRERMTVPVCAAVILSTAGLILVNADTGTSPAGQPAASLAGNALVFAAVTGEALFSVFCKLEGGTLRPLTTAAWVSVIGAALFLPPAIVESLKFDFASMNARDWILIIYSGLFVTVAAFIFWFRGISKVNASQAAVFTGAMPVTALLMSSMILGEKPDAGDIGGIICVLMAIVITAAGMYRSRFRS